MSFVKNESLQEPLIDTFNKKNILSNIYPIYVVDMYKIKENDINFTSNFELVFHKSDCLSALAGWFDVEFSKTPNTIKFTTSPFNQFTKWKQTIFYLEKNIKVEKGNIMKGIINLREQNSLDIDIKLDYEIINKNVSMISEEESDNSEINQQNEIKGTQMFKLTY